MPRPTVQHMLLATLSAVLIATTAFSQTAPTVVAVPRTTLIARTASSYPLGAADMMQQPVRLDAYGYVEEEYAVTGTAQIYDWNADGSLTVRHRDLPYTTRVLVRRPSDPAKFSGTVLVDVGNRGAG